MSVVAKLWTFVLLLPLAVLFARDAAAADPCGRLPQGGKVTVTVPEASVETACDANCSGININFPLPSNPAWGFTDGSRSHCAINTPGPAQGKCKKQTVCPPGFSRNSVNGTFKCVKPASTAQKDCPFRAPRALPFAIESSENWVWARSGTSMNYVKLGNQVERARSKPKNTCTKDGSTGLNYLVLRGPAVGAAAKATLVGLPAVSVSLQRPMPTDVRPVQCLMPNCVVAAFKIPAGAALGNKQLELSLLDGRKSTASFTLIEGREWVQTPCSSSGSSKGPPVAVHSDAPPGPQRESHFASMSCPGTQTVTGTTQTFTSVAATFNVHAASGSVTATATVGKTQDCWEGPIQFRLVGPSGQEIVFTPYYNSGAISYAPVTLQLANGDYTLAPPNEQNPNPDWPYGYNIVITFEQ